MSQYQYVAAKNCVKNAGQSGTRTADLHLRDGLYYVQENRGFQTIISEQLAGRRLLGLVCARRSAESGSRDLPILGLGVFGGSHFL
jgi:hypothetical protein